MGRRAQVGHKLSHEQNRLMRTKVRPALGKTTLIQLMPSHDGRTSDVDFSIEVEGIGGHSPPFHVLSEQPVGLYPDENPFS